MENELIKGLGSTTSGALVVTLLWFLRAAYKKYAGRSVIHVVKLINGMYGVKVRRGIGFARWVKFDSQGNYTTGVFGGIVQKSECDLAINVAKYILARHGVSSVDRVDVTKTGYTKEEPSL